MIEHFFLSLGLSFTTAKLIPYLLAVILGVCLVLFLRKRWKLKSKILNVVIRTVVFAAPFGVYFAFYPIYEGDFANGGEEVSMNSAYEELAGKKLTVITIPYCPYCEEAMERMKVLKERNSSMDIEYIVCSSDSSTLEFYTNISEGKIVVRLAESSEEMANLAKGHFPAFVLSKGDKTLKRWSNSAFGVRALDETEAAFH